jgi:GWxTD domain-containing protein
MSLIEALLETWVHAPGAAALGWTLVHSLWEGALVALALAGAFCVLRSGRARYAASCLALLALLAGFCITFQRILPQYQIQSVAPAHAIPAAPADLGDGSALAGIQGRFRAGDLLPWLVPFWIAGVVFFQLRGLASWMSARRMRGTGVCAATAFWQSRLDRLAVQVRLSRPVSLLESCLAEVPVVIGYLRPAILMPVGLLAGLPASQVESILLHELAHIRRHDYLVNLLQIFVESLVFYHPAVWWISGAIRAERENCCDDRVVAAQGDALAYAAALVALEQNRGAVRQAVLAATGGSLMKRVRRLLVQPEGPRATLTPVISAAILTITMAAATVAWQSNPPLRPPAPQVPPAPIALPAETPAPAPVRLLAQARKQGPEPVAQSTPYGKWLNEDVAYIITNEERATFKSLETRAELEHFIQQFWVRRDPTPGTAENEFKEEHYRRIAYANQNYGTAANLPGWKTDRGRIYITYGPPDEKDSHAGDAIPFELWRYRFIAGIGANVVIEFDDPNKTGEYRMTMDPSQAAAFANAANGPKAGATVQRLGTGATLISIPLSAYGDHRVGVYARVLTIQGRIVQSFEDSVQGPAPLYTKIIPLPAGSYRLQVSLKDGTSGAAAADDFAFAVK